MPDFEQIHKLIDEGVDVDHKTGEGVPILILGLQLTASLNFAAPDTQDYITMTNSVAKHLLFAGSDLTGTTPSGVNAIHMATVWGNTEALEFMLDSEASKVTHWIEL